MDVIFNRRDFSGAVLTPAVDLAVDVLEWRAVGGAVESAGDCDSGASQSGCGGWWICCGARWLCLMSGQPAGGGMCRRWKSMPGRG